MITYRWSSVCCMDFSWRLPCILMGMETEKQCISDTAMHMLLVPLSPILPSFPFASKFSSLYHREDMGKIRKGWEVGVALSGVVCAIILHTLMSGLATERKLPKSLKHRRISICYKCQPEVLNFCFACPESKNDLIWYLQSFKRSSKLDTYPVASFLRGRL
jgi:hypothetical protein